MPGDLDSNTGATEMNGPVANNPIKGPFLGSKNGKTVKKSDSKTRAAMRRVSSGNTTNNGIYFDKRKPITGGPGANFGNIHGQGPVVDVPSIGRLPKTKAAIERKASAAQRKVKQKSVFQDIDQQLSYGPPPTPD